MAADVTSLPIHLSPVSNGSPGLLDCIVSVKCISALYCWFTGLIWRLGARLAFLTNVYDISAKFALFLSLFLLQG